MSENAAAIIGFSLGVIATVALIEMLDRWYR